MKTILTIDIGSTSMRAIQYNEEGKALHKCRRATIPDYKSDKSVELDAAVLIANLLSMVKESFNHIRQKNYQISCISVTSQRSSVVPVNSKG